MVTLTEPLIAKLVGEVEQVDMGVIARISGVGDRIRSKSLLAAHAARQTIVLVHGKTVRNVILVGPPLAVPSIYAIAN